MLLFLNLLDASIFLGTSVQSKTESLLELQYPLNICHILEGTIMVTLFQI